MELFETIVLGACKGGLAFAFEAAVTTERGLHRSFDNVLRLSLGESSFSGERSITKREIRSVIIHYRDYFTIKVNNR